MAGWITAAGSAFVLRQLAALVTPVIMIITKTTKELHERSLGALGTCCQHSNTRVDLDVA